MNPITEEYVKQRETWLKEQGFFKRWIFNYVGKKIIEEKNSPFSYAFFPGTFSKRYLNNKRFNFTKGEVEKISQLMAYLIG